MWVLYCIYFMHITCPNIILDHNPSANFLFLFKHDAIKIDFNIGWGGGIHIALDETRGITMEKSSGRVRRKFAWVETTLGRTWVIEKDFSDMRRK